MAVVAGVLVFLAMLAAFPPPAPVSAPGRAQSRWSRSSRAPGDQRAGPRVLAALGAGLAAVLVVPGPAATVVAAAVAGIVWWRSRAWEGAGERRRRVLLEAQVPHVVDLMVAALNAGAAPGEALARVVEVVGAPVDSELTAYTARLRLGSDPVAVWSDLGHHPQLGRLGVALHRASRSGAPVATALQRLAADLRSQRRAEVEARVRQVEVRATVPLAVCLLPAFVLVGVVPLVAGSVTGLLSR